MEATCQALAEAGFTVAGLQARQLDLGAFGGLQAATHAPQAFPVLTPRVFPPRPYPYSMFLGSVARFIRRFAPELVLLAGEPSELAVAQVARLVTHQAPQARLTLYSLENLARRWRGFPQCLRRRAEEATRPRIDLYAAASLGTQSLLISQGVSPARIRVVVPAVTTMGFRRQDNTSVRAGLGVPAGSFVAGYVGRLVPEKGLELLLRAAVSLPADTHLVLVGDGPDEPRLRALTHSLGLREQVHFAGRQPHEALPAWYSAFDCLVLPSVGLPVWREQFGLVLAEAMLCGTPVIGSTCGAIPEVIADAGLLFPEGEVEALANHLRHLRADPARARALGEAGRRRAQAVFTPEAYVRRLVDFLREAATLPPRERRHHG